MEIKLITDQNYQKTWDEFVIKNSSPADFLQSWNWGEFRREKMGEKVLRLAVSNQGELVAIAQFIYQSLPLGRRFLFCPRGPLIKTQNSDNKTQEIINILIEEIKKIAREEKIIFVRFEPPLNCHPDENRDPEKKDWIPNQVWNDKTIIPKILTHSKNPENTLLLDLTKSEEEILAGMHPKWRYNIRLAEKRGINIVGTGLDLSKKNIEEFYKLLQETAKRDGIKIFSKKYYEDLINYFENSFYCHPDESRDPEKKDWILNQVQDDKIHVIVLLAYHQNKPLSAIMLLGFGDTLTYLHGGSANENRELMPNHAIQWSAIQWAKQQGYKWYDFWGIQNNIQNTINRTQEKNKKQLNNSENSWAGITRFKMGFVNKQTGKEINHLGARDFVINKMWYNLYRLGKIFNF